MNRLMARPTCLRVNNRVLPHCGGKDANPVPMPGKNNKDTRHG
ncbi:hypothetical protein [Serratia marcescens]|nr:hypothetical protein [Serratia marcescens]CAJ0994837.1 hypothetical protein NVIRSERR_01653 [Serratia marcescens]